GLCRNAVRARRITSLTDRLVWRVARVFGRPAMPTAPVPRPAHGEWAGRDFLFSWGPLYQLTHALGQFFPLIRVGPRDVDVERPERPFACRQPHMGPAPPAPAPPLPAPP